MKKSEASRAIRFDFPVCGVTMDQQAARTATLQVKYCMQAADAL
jgi:hypothetical protein